MRTYVIKYEELAEYHAVVFAGSYLRLADYFSHIEDELRSHKVRGEVLLDQFACNGLSSRFAMVRFDGRALELGNIRRVSCPREVVDYCDQVLMGMPDVLSNAVSKLDRP